MMTHMTPTPPITHTNNNNTSKNNTLSLSPPLCALRARLRASAGGPKFVAPKRAEGARAGPCDRLYSALVNAAIYSTSVSYTHLTLPTICSV
eukprot:4631987-Alexandrium_andersonii.AAC.1